MRRRRQLNGHPNPAAIRRGDIGDVNPIEYGGGYIYEAGSAEPWVEYFYGVETEAPDVDDPEDSPDVEVTMFSANLGHDAEDFLSQYDWVSWKNVARSTGQNVTDLTSHYNLRLLEMRAHVLQDVAGYYGWHELDQYPLRTTLGDLMERWEED